MVVRESLAEKFMSRLNTQRFVVWSFTRVDLLMVNGYLLFNRTS
jgi:hypothetical protein